MAALEATAVRNRCGLTAIPTVAGGFGDSALDAVIGHRIAVVGREPKAAVD